jgi:hypothetical protein
MPTLPKLVLAVYSKPVCARDEKGEGMTPDRIAKAKATRLAKKVDRQANSIEILPYRIVRVDDYNWQIQGPKLRTDGHFFFDIATALKALPATLLNAEAKNSLAVVLERLTAIDATIDRAIREAKRLLLLRG